MAHSVLVMAYNRIQRREPYRDAGMDVFDRLQPEDTTRRLVKRLESLGYRVTLQSPTTELYPNGGSYVHVSIKTDDEPTSCTLVVN